MAARGNLQKAVFQGQLHINDPNLAFDLDGEFNLNGPRKQYDLNGVVDHADLRALGYLSDSLTVRTNLDIQLEGSKLDDIVGSAIFNKATLGLAGRSLAIDQLTLNSTVERPTRAVIDSVSTQRYFDLDSDFLTTRLQGNFEPQRTIDDLTQLVREYQLYFKGDAAGMQAYYEQKRQRAARKAGRNAPLQPVRYGIDYQIITKNSRRY